MSKEKSQEVGDWYDVETVNEEAWYQILSNIQMSPKVASEICPSCRLSFLRFFYWRHGGMGKQSGGGGWIWCSTCRRFMHLSCEVPDWWVNLKNISGLSLTPFPDWLDTHWAEIAPQIVAMVN